MQYSTTLFGPIWLDNLDYCYSSTTDLRNCTRAVGVHNCNHRKDVTLTCSSKIKFHASYHKCVFSVLVHRELFMYTRKCDRFWENRPKRGKQIFSVSPGKALWVDFFRKFFYGRNG